MFSHVILNMRGKMIKIYMLNIMECAYNFSAFLLYFFVLIRAVHPEMILFGHIVNRCGGNNLV